MNHRARIARRRRRAQYWHTVADHLLIAAITAVAIAAALLFWAPLSTLEELGVVAATLVIALALVAGSLWAHRRARTAERWFTDE